MLHVREMVDVMNVLARDLRGAPGTGSGMHVQ
jgi:hypothetical protein